MTLPPLLNALLDAGAILQVRGDLLNVSAPKGRLSPALVQAVGKHKGALLQMLGPAQLPSPPGPQPGGEWDQRTAELVAWFVSAYDSLPALPFSLNPYTTVPNPAAFYAGLQQRIEQGPTSWEARAGKLAETLHALQMAVGQEKGAKSCCASLAVSRSCN